VESVDARSRKRHAVPGAIRFPGDDAHGILPRMVRSTLASPRRVGSFDIRPLTADRWPALEDLFGKTGACGGCWCMYWRIGSAYRNRPREENKAAFRQIVKRGPPPGLLAFDGDLAVGWCQITPRDALPQLDRARVIKRVDDVPVWCVSCFYVRRDYRNRGVTSALVQAALRMARRAGAPALEAYPVDLNSAPGKSTSGLYTGIASTFERAGFRTVARLVPHRPIMRHDLRAIRP